jgi:hypothetical protein
MDFGPIVAIEHDSRSPCGLETFCLLRFWLMWVFEFSSFMVYYARVYILHRRSNMLWGSTILGVTPWISVQLLRLNMILDCLVVSKLSASSDFGYCGFSKFPIFNHSMMQLWCTTPSTHRVSYLSTIRSLDPYITGIMLIYANRSKLNIHTAYQ